ncbi:MAG: YadA-like family protein, partial [Synergistaceae bacterium]|nr:YadA-like family protein [Synergistaceae bacterium]
SDFQFDTTSTGDAKGRLQLKKVEAFTEDTKASTNAVTAKAVYDYVSPIDTRLGTAESKLTTAEGNITTLQAKTTGISYNSASTTTTIEGVALSNNNITTTGALSAGAVSASSVATSGNVVVGTGAKQVTIDTSTGRISGLAAGEADTDAVNMSQLKTAVSGGYAAGDGIKFTAGAKAGDPTTVSVKLADKSLDATSGLKVKLAENAGLLLDTATEGKEGLKVKVNADSGITLDKDGLSLKADTSDFQFDTTSTGDAKGRLQLTKNGSVAQNNTGVVTGGAVYSAVSGAFNSVSSATSGTTTTYTLTALDGTTTATILDTDTQYSAGTGLTLTDQAFSVDKAALNISNISGHTDGDGTTPATTTFTGRVEGTTGTIDGEATTNKYFVTGDAVYTVTSGLDSRLGTAEGNITTLQTKTTGISYTAATTSPEAAAKTTIGQDLLVSGALTVTDGAESSPATVFSVTKAGVVTASGMVKGATGSIGGDNDAYFVTGTTVKTKLEAYATTAMLQAAVGSAYADSSTGKGLTYDATNTKLVSNVPLEVTDNTNKVTLSNNGNITVSNNGATNAISVTTTDGKQGFSLANTGNAVFGNGVTSAQIKLDASIGAITVKKANESKYLFNLTSQGNLIIAGMLSSTSKDDANTDELNLRMHTVSSENYGTVIKNVAEGSADMDAVNYGQVKGAYNVVSSSKSGTTTTYTLKGIDESKTATILDTDTQYSAGTGLTLTDQAFSVDKESLNISNISGHTDGDAMAATTTFTGRVEGTTGTIDGEETTNKYFVTGAKVYATVNPINSRTLGLISYEAADTSTSTPAKTTITGKLTTDYEGDFDNLDFVTKKWVVAHSLTSDSLQAAVGSAYYIDPSTGTRGNGLYYDSANSKLVSNVPVEMNLGSYMIKFDSSGRISGGYAENMNLNQGFSLSPGTFQVRNFSNAYGGAAITLQSTSTTNSQLSIQGGDANNITLTAGPSGTGSTIVVHSGGNDIFKLDKDGNLTITGQLKASNVNTSLMASASPSDTTSETEPTNEASNGTENDANSSPLLTSAAPKRMMMTSSRPVTAAKPEATETTTETVVADEAAKADTTEKTGDTTGDEAKETNSTNSKMLMTVARTNTKATDDVKTAKALETTQLTELKETPDSAEVANNDSAKTEPDDTSSTETASNAKVSALSSSPNSTDFTKDTSSATTHDAQSNDTQANTPDKAVATQTLAEATPTTTSTAMPQATAAPVTVSSSQLVQTGTADTTPLGEINVADLKGKAVTDTAVHNYVSNYVNDVTPKISYTDAGGAIQTESMSGGTLAAGNNLRITKETSGAANTYKVDLKDEISGVKSIELTEEAAINVGSKKVATVGQVASVANGVQETLNNVNRVLNDTNIRINEVETRSNQVGAHAAALSSLHPLPYNPDAPTSFSAGVGTYRDEVSYAIGVFHYTSDRFMFNLGASVTKGADVMGRAGMSFSLGKGGKSTKTARKEAQQLQGTLADIVKGYSDMNNQHAMLASQQQTLSKRNHELEAANEENTKRIQQLEEQLAVMKEYIESKKKEEEEKKRKEEEAKKKNAKTKNKQNVKKSNSKKK